MDVTALLLSRIQFAFTITFHIIFPSFTIGLAAWLAVLEALGLKTGRPVFRVLFKFWLKIFGVAFGLGVVSGVVGYALLGACWLVKKCHAEVRDVAHRQIPVLAGDVLAFLVLVFVYALAEHLPILHRWIDRPYLFVFPTIGAVAAIVLALSILHHNDHWPFYAVAVIFVSAFGTLALSFWPYIIPFVITIDEAAAPQSSLIFMFWGGVVVFPLMLLYTLISYSVFRGKVGSTAGHY